MITIHGRLKSTSAKKDSVSASKVVQEQSNKASEEQRLSKSSKATKEKEVKRGMGIGIWPVLSAIIVAGVVVYVQWKWRKCSLLSSGS